MDTYKPFQPELYHSGVFILSGRIDLPTRKNSSAIYPHVKQIPNIASFIHKHFSLYP